MKLEYVDALTLAHPFIKGFDRVFYCLNEEELRACAQGEVSDAVAKRKKDDLEGKEGTSTIYTTTFFIGLAIEPKQRTYPLNFRLFIVLLCFYNFNAIIGLSWFRWTSKIRYLVPNCGVH